MLNPPRLKAAAPIRKIQTVYSADLRLYAQVALTASPIEQNPLVKLPGGFHLIVPDYHPVAGRGEISRERGAIRPAALCYLLSLPLSSISLPVGR